MNVTEMIDQVLGRDDNVDDTGADNTERRIRHLEYLREVAAEVWWESDWSWKKKRDTITIPAATGYVELPPDFQSLGHYGGIYYPIPGVQGDGRRLKVSHEGVITDLREADYQTSNPWICSIFGQGPFYRQYVQIPIPGQDITLAVWYQSNPPRLDEVVGFTAKTDIAMTAVDGNQGTLTASTTDFTTQFLNQKYVRISGFANEENNGEFEIVGTVAANSMPLMKPAGDTLVAEALGPSVVLEGHVNDIKKIPEKYHQSVIMPGLRAKARESKGDARWQTSVNEYARGRKMMKMEEQRFQGEWRQLPSFFGRT